MLAALIGILACTGEGEETGAPEVTYDQLQYVFDRNCISCHGETDPGAGLVLLAEASHAALVDVASTQVPEMRRVAPGDADASYLLHKLRGTHDTVGGTGTSMPPYLVLADTELELFRAWIAAGAAP